MDLLDRWIEQIPESENPQEITKQEILNEAHCNLSGYFSRQCSDLHGRTLKILFEYDWPDKTPGPLNVYPSRIQTGLEWLCTLLDPLTKFAYLQRVNKTYPKSQAPLHKIRESLLRDKANNYKAFRRFQNDILNFWREHAKPLNPGRDWRENERLAMKAFYSLTETKPEGLTGKLALAFMVEKLSTLCGNSQLSGQKLDVFSRFLQEFCKILQVDYAEAFIEIGGRAIKSDAGKKPRHPELDAALIKFLADRRAEGKKTESSIILPLLGTGTRQKPFKISTKQGYIAIWAEKNPYDQDDSKFFFTIKNRKKPTAITRSLKYHTFRKKIDKLNKKVGN